MWLAVIAIILGLALLVWSADVFIGGATALAKKLKVPSFLIGLVILGLGSSAPEMVVSILAALQGSPREDAPGTVKGGVLSTLVSDIEIVCLPSLLPAYLEVDVSGMEIGDLFRLSDINLPEGVIIFDLDMEDAHDRTIVNMQPPTVEEVDEEADVAAAEVPATAQADKDAE